MLSPQALSKFTLTEGKSGSWCRGLGRNKQGLLPFPSLQRPVGCGPLPRPDLPVALARPVCLFLGPGKVCSGEQTPAPGHAGPLRPPVVWRSGSLAPRSLFSGHRSWALCRYRGGGVSGPKTDGLLDTGRPGRARHERPWAGRLSQLRPCQGRALASALSWAWVQSGWPWGTVGGLARDTVEICHQCPHVLRRCVG